MAQRVSYGKVVLLGLFAGGVFGVSQGLLHDSVWYGLIMGVLCGGAMAVVMRRVLGSTALRGLDRGQRRAVSRAMRRGEPVEDPRLARPLVDQADAVLSMPYPAKSLRVGAAVVGAFGLVTMVVGFRSEGPAGLGGGALLLVLSLLVLFALVPAIRRQRERMLRSQEVTRERHGLSEVAPSAER
ncbi:hypothetical protein LZG04_26005 [Saccharothrix sp. S26]|uniref:hypothetical protein n=1 Tax=Saccharothrix sp. S26 TaxID=2907215 RepID=UPI001F37F6F4|nr:hypothetical protein [Saccharothrix sp. S26]MCE6998225.1 hypothetical protein [Saccharothrix sp. S26]